MEDGVQIPKWLVYIGLVGTGVVLDRAIPKYFGQLRQENAKESANATIEKLREAGVFDLLTLYKNLNDKVTNLEKRLGQYEK